MNERSLPALIVLNVALLASLLAVTLAPQPAQAQFGGAKAGNFVMIAGDVRGRSNQQMIYVLDLNNSRLATGFYNSSNNTFDWVAARVVSDDVRGGGANR